MKYKTDLIEKPELLDGGMALAAITRAEVDLQIQTAKSYPRDIERFRSTAMSIVTADEETAASMFYAMPRSGKSIEGPSVRLAEVVASTWGNMRVQSRITSIDEKFVTAMAMCHDLESNLAVSVDVRRRITNKAGKRFNDDMIVVTSNAACAIAYREAIFKTVPRHFINALYDEARQVAIGNARTLASRRAAVVTYFGKMGVPIDTLCRGVGVPSEEHIGLDELAILRGMATAIKEGSMTVDDAFPVVESVGPPADAPPLTGDSLFSGEAILEEPPKGLEEPPKKKKRGRPKKKAEEPQAEEPKLPETSVLERHVVTIPAQEILDAMIKQTGLATHNESACDMDLMDSLKEMVGELTNAADIRKFVSDVVMDDSYNDDERMYVAQEAANVVERLETPPF
jgi:hypothetical protein